METSKTSDVKQSKVKMKVIPWHCQQRYQSTLSQISLNHTVTEAQYHRKVKSLLNNNKCLAKALEHCRYELAGKEAISLENTKNIDIINFSGIKLRDLSNNLKKITSSVDETLALLGSYASIRTSQNFQCPSSVRRDFKNRIRAVSGMEKLDEVPEIIETKVKSSTKSNFKVNQKPVLANDTNKNFKGKNTCKVSTCKNKPKKHLSKASVKLPIEINQRASNPVADDQTPPSYLLGVSSELDNCKSLVKESKATVESKAPGSKKPPKSNQKHSSGLHSKNAKKVTEESESFKNIIKPSLKDKNILKVICETSNGKAALCKKRKVTFSLQDGSSKSQEHVQKTTSNVTHLKNAKMGSCFGFDCEMGNFNKGGKEARKLNTAIIYEDLESSPLMSQPIVLLENTALPPILEKKLTEISMHKITDGYSEQPKENGSLKKNSEATISAIPKKKAQFHLDKEDVIEMLSDSQDNNPTVKKPQKRPLKDNTQDMASVPKRQALYTVGGELDKVKINGENTYIVTAEVHTHPEDFIKKKGNGLKDIEFMNMNPYVLLTDIFKSSLHKKWLGDHNSPLAPAKPTIKNVEEKELVESLEMPSCENISNDVDLNAMYDKENKIDEQIILEERKPHRRTSTKVTSYKEMNLNVKMRRC